MFRDMMRAKQQLTREECVEILKNEPRGVLSVLGDDGYPYALPINQYYCEEDGCLYFHSGQKGHKIDALKRDDHACFCAYDGGSAIPGDWALNFKSVIVFGRVRFVEDPEKAFEISRRLSYKFTSDKDYVEDEIRRSGARVLVFALVPEHITGKRVNEK